jgi:glycosyltransferase involved in cell wall biosynthesis
VKIAILSHNLSYNCLGRAYILAKVLSNEHQVEIVGPADTNIWQPVSFDKTIKYIFLSKFHLIRNLKLIDADIIYAIKPKGFSFGYGLMRRLLKRTPLILDIDDWEWGGYLDVSRTTRLRGIVGNIAKPWDLNGALYTYILDHITKVSSVITVSNSFLQSKYGGELIPHFRNTKEFDPELFKNTKLKQRLKLENQKIILFLGTPRKHKGISALITAFKAMNRSDTTLMIVGSSQASQLKSNLKDRIKVYGQQPFNKIPEFLAIADIVTIFQASTNATKGQLPAKVFDAMAMARPIIASNISDLAAVLEGCGVLVNPGDTDSLAREMSRLLDNKKTANRLGKLARKKCIDQYSNEAIHSKLSYILDILVDNERLTAMR